LISKSNNIMGIKNLFKLLESEAPDSFREIDIKSCSSKIIAIDASMQLYQFLVQVRISSGPGSYVQASQLMNEKGEITSHIQGFLSRTVGLIEKGIKPVFVFDGTPPKMKHEELSKRRKMKAKADDNLDEAKERLANASTTEEADLALEEVNNLSKRTVRVTKEHNEDVKKLLRLMGIPIVESPSEAEAQCVELVKSKKAYAVATEDMDSLTFAAPILLKRLTDSKHPTVEIKIAKVLSGLGLSYDQFVDLCILSGCDYCGTIPGIGSKTALKLIKEHGDIETIALNTKKPIDPEFLENLPNVRKLFKDPDVTPSDDISIKFNKPDVEGLLNFLVVEKGFNIDRVTKVIDRLTTVRKKGTQTTLDSFFTQ
jgi:flap endonuclease-1